MGAGRRAAIAVGLACAVCVEVVPAACITAIPDLPQYPPLAPVIETDAVRPPPGTLLEWPEGGEFTIPVEVFTPGESFVYEVVYDYGTNNQSVLISELKPQFVPDGGIATVTVLLPIPPLDVCPNTIDFIVANAFQAVHVPDSVGGSLVTWTYAAGGGPDGCPSFDAGTGELPDASTDSLPVVGGDQ
jgi:hypothetical protein